MSSLHPVYVVPLAVLACMVALMAGLAVRRAARAATRRRIVEPPNSHFDSPIVRENDALKRWRGVALDTVHEINRSEVERLIARAEAAGVPSLTPIERAFLDQVAVPAAPPAPRDRPRTIVTELHHRPA